MFRAFGAMQSRWTVAKFALISRFTPCMNLGWTHPQRSGHTPVGPLIPTDYDQFCRNQHILRFKYHFTLHSLFANHE